MAITSGAGQFCQQQKGVRINMAKRGVIIAIVLTSVVCVGGTSAVWLKIHNDSMAIANEQISTLNTTIDNIGQCATVYTVSGKVLHGTEIKASDLIATSVPSSMISENWVTDPSQVEGLFYKVDIERGTPLTLDLCMSEQIDDTTREHDICFDYWPVGLQAGDSVDICLQLPYGEEYIVVPKLLVRQINENSIKVDMNSEEWNVYQSALVDYYLHVEQGSSIYLAKYVEPGVQDEAIPFYSVRNNIKAAMLLNPNLINLATESLSDSLRQSVDKVLDAVDANSSKTNEEEQSALSSGRKAFQDNVNNDYTTKRNEQLEAEQQEAMEAEQADIDEAQSSSSIDNMQDAIDEVSGMETSNEGGLQ